ncbi:ubiquitin carboxyl-terminal hydrolase [Striga asiatica]|uniref:Ubiquitin carboxyl-terminal hydrolase n=1 Tax=Striga asiatica TaxID=4170 RepID=A0A5A7PCL1_STRAF|nr:ubiquitin carboxyl-terminal hydrolase [Striga asiatica]
MENRQFLQAEREEALLTDLLVCRIQMVSWGYPAFISHDELHDRTRGYIVKDTCLIEVELCVTSFTPAARPADPSICVDSSVDILVYLETMDSIYTNAQSFLRNKTKRSFGWTPALNIRSSPDDVERLANGPFNELIKLQLDEFADPKLENAMTEALFNSGEQIQQTKRLRLEFPRMMEDWKDSVRLLEDGQSFLLDYEENFYQLKDAVESEGEIVNTLDKVRDKCKYLEEALEDARKEAKRLVEQRREASKTTHRLYVAAEEKNPKSYITRKRMESIVQNQSLEACKVTKLAWKIDNFSKLNVKKLFSQTCSIAGYKWRIFVYPKGNKADGYLSLYIDVIDEPTAPFGWFVEADITFVLVDQFDQKKSVDRETKGTFKHGQVSWGYPTFISHDKLHDQTRGYIVDDTCLIEVELCVSSFTPFPSNNNARLVDPLTPVDPSVDNLVYLETMDSIYTNAQSFLKNKTKRTFGSIITCTPVLNIRSSPDKVEHLANGPINELIRLPLDEFADPKLENAMREALFVNLSHSFTDEQIQQIKRLRLQFPRIMEDWKDSVQLLEDGQSFLSDYEKNVNQLEDAVKSEEGVKSKLDEVIKKCKELEEALEEARKEAKKLVEQRREASKTTHRLYVTAEEKNPKVEGKEMDISQAKDELDELRAEWETYKSQFFA